MLDNYLVFGASRGVWSLPGFFSLFLPFFFFFCLFCDVGVWGWGCYMQKGGSEQKGTLLLRGSEAEEETSTP